MKILFLSDSFPPNHFGGSEIVAHYLAKELEKKGHKLHIITTVQKKSLKGISNFENLKVYNIYSNYHPRWQGYLSLYNPQTVSKVEKIIREVKPDIVHSHNIHYYLSYHCFKIAKKYAKAVFLTAHDVMLIHYGKLMPKNGNCIYKVSFWDQIKEARKRYNPFRNLLIRHYLKYLDKIFAISNYLKEFLELNGIKKIETVCNGIDEWEEDKKEVNKFKNKYNLQKKKIILFGGRLSGAKGGEVILKTMKGVVGTIKDSVLLVAGEKDWYSQEMLNLASKLGIGNKVKFSGWLDRREMKSAIFTSDICVVPSIYPDPFNLFNIEAGAAKKPVVGTCFGGTPEIIVNNKTGYIVDPNNTDLMAEKIIDLLKNPEKAEKFGDAGYKRVKERFSLDKQVKETLKWYKTYV